MSDTPVSIAIVEDNGVARLNLRNHLMEMGFTDVACFSQGRELKAALRKAEYDIVLMDYHLGMNKNGVEVIQELQRLELIKNTTSVIFITSDRLPMIVGQIVDVYPDALVLKPYTIRILERTLRKTIKLNELLRPVLSRLDSQQYEQALSVMEEVAKGDGVRRHHGAINKLRARIYIKMKRFDDAIDIYQDALSRSNRIIWARWGLIQATYLKGDIDKAQLMLETMLDITLTNDKAAEWLTRIAIGKDDLDHAEDYMDKIKESEISLPAARLKAYLFQLQGRMPDAVKLLEKKRQSNKDIREHFSELSFDLARLHITDAEEKSGQARTLAINAAKVLIGSAVRRSDDDNVTQKRNFLNALIHVLDHDPDKAIRILNEPGMGMLENADPAALADASAAFFGVGDEARASEIMEMMEKKLNNLPDENEKTMSSMLLKRNEQKQGDKKTRAMTFNKEGLGYYTNKKYNAAIDLFYQASSLVPAEPAFKLNLLQSMVEARIKQHKKANVLRLYDDLKRAELSSANASRLRDLGRNIDEHYDEFVVSDLNLSKDPT